MKVVTLLDETLRFVSLETRKCHVQHTARMAPYAERTLCGHAIPDGSSINPKRAIADNYVCGHCIRVLHAYYTGSHGHLERARIGEVEVTV